MHLSVVKKIIFLSLAGFFVAIVAVAFNPQDDTFLLRSRSFCQARAAISGVVNKNQIDSAPAMTVASLGAAAIFLLSAPFVHTNTTIFISSRTGYIFPNKAPPARS